LFIGAASAASGTISSRISRIFIMFNCLIELAQYRARLRGLDQHFGIFLRHSRLRARRKPHAQQNEKQIFHIDSPVPEC
jgi:hypothetical protein